MSELANILSLSHAGQVSHNISTIPPTSATMLHNNLELYFLALPFLPLLPMAVVLCLRRYTALKKERKEKAYKALWTLAFNLAKSAHVQGNREQLVAMVEECKIGVNEFREPNTGLTLLLCACLSGQSELVKFLLDRGVDCRAKTSEGDSALLLSTYACCTLKSSDPLLLDVLACRGSNINEQNERGDSPLSIAAQYGKTRLISVLLQYGADPFLANCRGILPIDFAGSSGNFEAAKLLENYMKQSH